ncbi:MAG: phytanoyl-CoA dioxygenase family protein [Planctomycetes bacterium]|nr:phytanoyl-CoA dioxygenase family protein [Planctomycetota bacterium]
MRSSVTPEHISHYRENGFVLVEDLLDQAEIAELSAAVAHGVAEMGDRKIVGGNDWKDGDSFYDNVFVQRLNLWKNEPVVKRYMLGAEIGAMASALAGVDALRVWHDQTLQKKPWANPTSWHLDTPYWSFDSRDALSIWIALDDVTMQNGCMYYLPGSNRLVNFENVGIGPNMGDLFNLYPALKTIEPVAVPMRAGSCAFHNGLTAHAAGPNMTPRWRRAMTCAYMPDGCTFNGKGNILTAEQIARLKIGDRLDDEQQNPLLDGAVSAAAR